MAVDQHLAVYGRLNWPMKFNRSKSLKRLVLGLAVIALAALAIGLYPSEDVADVKLTRTVYVAMVVIVGLCAWEGLDEWLAKKKTKTANSVKKQNSADQK